MFHLCSIDNMGHSPILPKAYQTVGKMHEADISIKAYCQKCREAFKVDLVAIIMTKGPDYSLIGRHPICRIYDCEGRCSFLVSAGRGTPMVTLDRWQKEGQV